MTTKLKYSVEKIIALFLKCFYIFPIKQNRVIFSSFSGRQYSDSPRRISELLAKKAENTDIIWAFTEPECFAFLKKKGITVVKYKSLKYLYFLFTSKVCVDNVEYWSVLRFRKNQMVLQTWHGGGAYKRIGFDRIDIGDAEKQHVLKKMARTTHFISSSKAFTDYVIRGAYRFKGKILPVGLPRNDELLHPDESKKVETREKLSLSNYCKIAIYAPTFRNSKTTELYDIDYDRLLNSLEMRFGGNWKLLVRFHYYLTDGKTEQLKNENIINVSNYPDMQELLQISDVLITDYSSTVWDFALTGKPAFLYARDIKEYAGERDFYTPIESWPFPLAENNDELSRKIETFNEIKYKYDIKHHLEDLGNCETGEATEKAVECILEFLGGKVK